MLTYRLRQSANDPNVWAVLLYNPDNELVGTVTFQGALSRQWAADYFDLQTALNAGTAMILVKTGDD